MSFEIKIPGVGESITEVTVGQWIAEDGTYVEMDNPICELESEKATFELNAEVAGVLKQNAKEGETLEIGAVIGFIDEQAKSSGASKTDDGSTSIVFQNKLKKTGQVLEMVVPNVGESIKEVTIGSWSKEEGDYVEMDEVIAEIESEKATFELTAEAQGYLNIVAKEGDTLEIGALICKIEAAEGDASSSAGKESP